MSRINSAIPLIEPRARTLLLEESLKKKRRNKGRTTEKANWTRPKEKVNSE